VSLLLSSIQPFYPCIKASDAVVSTGADYLESERACASATSFQFGCTTLPRPIPCPTSTRLASALSTPKFNYSVKAKVWSLSDLLDLESIIAGTNTTLDSLMWMEWPCTASQSVLLNQAAQSWVECCCSGTGGRHCDVLERCGLLAINIAIKSL